MGGYISTPLKTLATIAPIVATILMLGLYKFQTKLIYASSFPEHSRTIVDTPDKYDIPWEDVTITTQDDEKLKAFVMMQADRPKEVKTVLMLNPNAGNIGHALPLAEMFYKKMGYNVVLYSYRGYGHSTGIANEKGLKLDAMAVMDYLSAHPVIQHTSVVLYGRSLGGAVAFHIASIAQKYGQLIQAIVVENTFLSIPKVVPNVLPWLGPLTFLCTEKWDTEQLVPKLASNLPVLFLSGQVDELVPPPHMKRLFSLCTSEVKQWRVFARGHHNDTTVQPGYWQAVHEFISNSVKPYENLAFDINSEKDL